MSEKLHRPFIPAWFDDYGLTPAQFRVFSTLLRHENNGVAWPSIDRIITLTGMSKATIRRSIAALENENLIRKIGKPFAGSCRYELLPIVSPENPLELSNSITREPIESPPIVSPETHNRISHDTSIVSPETHDGELLKVNYLQKDTCPQADVLAALWNLCPEIGKSRSSKNEVKEAWRKIPEKDRPDQTTVIEAFRKWTLSNEWTKDGGQFVCGLHRWIKRRMWEVVPQGSKAVSEDDFIKQLGGRAAGYTPNAPDHSAQKVLQEFPEPKKLLPRL